jgi:hypothetical protein
MSIVSVRPYATLLVLALIAFWPLVLHPTETLYSNHSDLLAQHIPAKYFLVRSLRETGELPLWNPEQYAGSPFVHDIQVGLFYPPNLPLYFISEPAIGPFVSWLVFVHVLLAGWFMYAYSRHAGLGELAAFVAGVGYMLSPRWMLQLFEAGHTITQGICWLPLILLCVERAIIRKRWSWAVGGGVAYALLILGTHPQWTLYASVVIGLWPLRLSSRERMQKARSATEAALQADFGEPGAAEPEASAKATVILGWSASPSLTLQAPPNEPTSRRILLVRWLVAEAIVVIIGLALCAVQLLPTMEAAGETSRAKGMGQSWSLDGAKAAATTLIGPIPDRQIEPIHWETRGCIGFTWAVMAIVGVRLGGRRAFVPTLIALGMLAYALGGSYFIDRLPGFNNFRMPTRMLLTLAFPMAFLAALGVQSLGNERANSAIRLATAFWAVVLVSFATIAYLRGYRVQDHRDIDEWCWGYWLVIAASWSMFFAIGVRLPSNERSMVAAFFMVVDVLIVSLQYPDTRPAVNIYPPSPAIDYIRQHNPDGLRIYDEYNLLGSGSPAASVHGVPSIRGFNPLDVARYRQFLAVVAGRGENQGAFTSGFTHPVIQYNFSFSDKRLLDLAGVRFVVSQRCQWPEETSVLFRAERESVYDFLGLGVDRLPVQDVMANLTVMPRAFVVTDATAQVPEDQVAGQLHSTDVRCVALIDHWSEESNPLPKSPSITGPASIRSHKPNEIIIDLDGRTAGLLVLTDPWYPGWVCRVDGHEVPIWKADYAFRGVMVSEGSREVVFHFEPQSYRRGKWISLFALATVGLLLVITLVRRRK